ncbi:MAG TPA: universal stress protein [Azospirillum sp.]|nr:universal stress protein [Azospirillum sp.]
MRSILLATDLTPLSDRAVERALRLAGAGGRLTVLHTIQGDPYAIDGEEECRRAETRLRAQLGAEGGGGRGATVVVGIGDPAEEIARHARRASPDVIVLGAHRQSLLGDLFDTATAQRIVDARVAPVLSVQAPVTGDYRTVLVGMDTSEASGRALAAALAAFPDAAFTVVHAYHVPFGGFLDSPDNRRAFAEQHRQEMSALVHEVGQRTGRPDLGEGVKLCLRDGETVSVLLQEVRHAGPDLLVIGTSGSGNRLFGGVAATIVTQPPCDLMIVPAASGEPA